MGKGNISQLVTTLIQPAVDDEGLDLVDVEFKKEGKNWYLRIFIEKAQGVTLEDCQNISHRIEDLIEIESIISRQYILEVSSPGLDRPLKSAKDFLRNKNRPVAITVFSPLQGRKNFSGVIKTVREQSLILDEQGTELEIPLEKIAKAKLVINFS